MILKKCKCGGAAAIRTEYDGKLYIVRAVCESCGKQGRKMYAKAEPGRGAAAICLASVSWNCGLYEEVKP